MVNTKDQMLIDL